MDEKRIGVDYCSLHGDEAVMSFSCLTCRDVKHHKELKMLLDQLAASQAREREAIRERDELKAARMSYANLFDGDVGSIHQNIRGLKEKVERMEIKLRLIRDITERFHQSDAQRIHDLALEALAPSDGTGGKGGTGR